MKFYHGTSRENWEKIKKEGVLWGYRVHDGIPTLNYRYTYLSPHIEVAEAYGDIILEVEYSHVGVDGRKIDNYGFDPPPGQTCWQFSIFVPILIKDIKIFSEKDNFDYPDEIDYLKQLEKKYN